MFFTLISPLLEVGTFASGSGVRDQARLRKQYGGMHWRKRKGYARVRLSDGSEGLAELHWYKAHGVGKREMKLKRFIE
jgi:hypothetical protein